MFELKQMYILLLNVNHNHDRLGKSMNDVSCRLSRSFMYGKKCTLRSTIIPLIDGDRVKKNTYSLVRY
jgi:hypothetical protein